MISAVIISPYKTKPSRQIRGFNKGRLPVDRKQLLRSQGGFTLIEIISVLVLLGILAAVAVPKFINLQADARNKAAEAAVAEGVAQVNLYSAKFILINSRVPTTLGNLTNAAIGLTNPYTQGDFTIRFANVAGGQISITATGKNGTSVAGATATKTVLLPQ